MDMTLVRIAILIIELAIFMILIIIGKSTIKDLKNTISKF